MISHDTVTRILELVRRRYPGWQSVSEPGFVNDEIGYKRKAVAKAREMLAPERLRSLIGAGKYQEVTALLRKAASATNLLYMAAPKTSDLGVLFDTRLDPQTFYPALFDLLHGDGPAHQCVGRFATYLTARKLPNRWTFATYFRYLLHPETDLFIKPKATKEFLERADLPDLPQQPSEDAYLQMLTLGADLLSAFAPMGAQDMVDVQSVMWVAGTAKAGPTRAGPGTSRTWTIGAGEGARYWDEFLEKSIVAIGWPRLGDLTRYGSKEAVAHAIKQAYAPEGEPIMDALCCYQFMNEMSPGDTVFVKQGLHRILAIGTVTSDYRFDPGRAEYPNVRDVKWKHVGSFDLSDDYTVATKTLTDVTEYSDFVDYVIQRARGGAPSPQPRPKPRGYTIEDALDGLFVEPEDFTSWIDALERKKNVILEGAPGVGKTYVARRLADAFVGVKDSDRVLMLQFHQSYSYEEFIRGWRPAKNTGGYVLHDGVFLSFCRRAAAAPDDRHVLVIDEINRGNVSRIFGELFMLLEADKRGAAHSLPLAYDDGSGERFSVPENVYLIGTMNTADRSLAMVDYALRRRFAFVMLKPAFGTDRFHNWLESRGVEEDLVRHIEERMGALNQAIAQDLRRLGPGFEIGHSFFCAPETVEDVGSAWFKAVIRNEIAPLINEYWFDAPETASEHLKILER